VLSILEPLRFKQARLTSWRWVISTAPLVNRATVDLPHFGDASELDAILLAHHPERGETPW
jgi:hypothetical protein